MVMLPAALALTALAAAGSAAPTEPRAANACASGVYIIVARGTNEPAGQGKTSQVAQMVAAQIPGSISVAVDYPATAFKKRSLYPESVTAGINDTIKKIHDYVAACGATSRIVLMGWSQGGNVMTDTLAGGVLKPDPLGDEYHQYIKAVTVFGDPSFSANHTYDYGSNARGSMEGIFARHNSGSLAKLQTYAGVLASYCDVNDAFCASGDNSNDVHGQEVPKHAQEATDFIVARAK